MAKKLLKKWMCICMVGLVAASSAVLLQPPTESYGSGGSYAAPFYIGDCVERDGG